MLAQLLTEQKPVEENPLHLETVATPEPQAGEVRVRIAACGVCHTDLHVVQGDIHPTLTPIIPGHQIVGRVDARGAAATRLEIGARVGIPWLNWISPDCRYYGTDRENLCDDIRFTGFHVNGGFAEYITVDEKFAYPVPDIFSDVQAAPLLCAGVIGFRALRLSEIALPQAEYLGLYGFGASAHIVLQIARHWGKTTYIFTRNPEHRRLALELGAAWAGAAGDVPPHKLDSAIIFAPVGDLVVQALHVLNKGGTVVHAGIYSTPVPQFDYPWLYEERTIRSAAHSTRRDVEELLRVAAEIPVRPEVQLYPLAEANRALQDLKHSRIQGAAVLQIIE
ncbi:MAG: zinc-dependent alcohol dehydrogenase family protein [Anaerolineae bacterium]